MVTTNVTSEEERMVYKIALNGVGARMNERIPIGTFGATRTNIETTQG